MLRIEGGVPTFELETRKIVARLRKEGWIEAGGSKHDKFEHPSRSDVVMIVPRHKQQSLGVARSIAKLAGWV